MLQIYVTMAKIEPSVILPWKRYFQSNLSTLSQPASTYFTQMIMAININAKNKK